MKSLSKAKSALMVSLATTTLLLSACGGGGGGSDSSSNNGGTPPANLPSTDLVSSVPAPTYGTGTPAETVFNRINALRGKIGSGLLTQDAQLDTAAKGHLIYLGINGITGGHTQNVSLTGFTGVTPSARATAAGYSSSVGEVIAAFGGNDRAAECATNWENSVYHMSMLFDPSRDIGVAAGNVMAGDPVAPWPATACVVNFGTKLSAGPQLPPASVPLVYPYADQTGVIAAFNNQAESPTPVPDLNGVGHPVGMRFSGAVSAVASFTITPTGGNAIASRILAGSGVTGPGVVLDSLVGATEVFLVPVMALAPNTAYQVSFSGTVGGAQVTKIWSFTTAS